MEHLLDATITQAYKAKKADGSFVEGEDGAWRLYNFHTDKTGDKKFGFMWSAKKPIPCKGLKIKHLEYEVKIEGKYTNYNAKTIEVDPDTPPMKAEPQTSKGSTKAMSPATNGHLSMYVSYAKDIAIEMIQEDNTLPGNFEAVCSRVAKAGVQLMNTALDVPEEPQNVPEDNLTPEEVANSFKDTPEEPKTVPPIEDDETGRGKDRVLRSELKKYAKVNYDVYMKTLGQHGAANGEQVIAEFSEEQQKSLFKDLEKEISLG